jgi:hypothetical protein
MNLMFKMKLLSLTNFIQLKKGIFYNKIIFEKNCQTIVVSNQCR